MTQWVFPIFDSISLSSFNSNLNALKWNTCHKINWSLLVPINLR